MRARREGRQHGIGGVGMNRRTNRRARAEVWLYRRLRPLVIEREGRSLPEIVSGREERRRLVAVRVRKLAAGALLVAAVGTGGAWFGYGAGHDAGALEGAAGLPLDRGGVPSWVEEVCRAEGEAAAQDADKAHRAEGIGPLVVAAAERERCEAEATLDVAERHAQAAERLGEEN